MCFFYYVWQNSPVVCALCRNLKIARLDNKKDRKTIRIHTKKIRLTSAQSVDLRGRAFVRSGSFLTRRSSSLYVHDEDLTLDWAGANVTWLADSSALWLAKLSSALVGWLSSVLSGWWRTLLHTWLKTLPSILLIVDVSLPLGLTSKSHPKVWNLHCAFAFMLQRCLKCPANAKPVTYFFSVGICCLCSTTRTCRDLFVQAMYCSPQCIRMKLKKYDFGAQGP